jgi:hypothetical protein
MRRRGSVFALSAAEEQGQEDERAAQEKKRERQREHVSLSSSASSMPIPQLPDLHRTRSEEPVLPFVPTLGHEFRMTLPLVQNLKHDGINTVSCATVKVSLFCVVFSFLSCSFFVGHFARTVLHSVSQHLHS